MDEKIDECLALVLRIDASIIKEQDSQSSLESFGLDSLHAIQLIVLLEETFGIEFYDENFLLENVNTKERIRTTLSKYDLKGN